MMHPRKSHCSVSILGICGVLPLSWVVKILNSSTSKNPKLTWIFKRCHNNAVDLARGIWAEHCRCGECVRFLFQIGLAKRSENNFD